ncbi:MAG: response regulator [Alphaproteobacteria bacterium]|nr:MAG: response regulator [Alphaproteobacteria bacterium]
MKKDLLILYAANHRGVLYNILTIAAIFLALRHHMYGAPETGIFSLWKTHDAGFFENLLSKPGLSYIEEIWLVLFCGLMLKRQRAVYARVMTGKFKEAEYTSLITTICFNKLLYMIPWLYLMFMPLESQYIANHLLGFVFVFALTATTASASAPVMPLLIFDIVMPALFGIGVALLNFRIQEHPYAAAAVLVFAIYAVIIGHKIRQSTLQLIDSKIQMQQSAKRADDANRAKSAFLALMSHEIRTPMTGIFGMIDFLRETKMTDEQKEFVVTIRDCSKTLLNTLNDILDFSKIESGKLAIAKVNFDLHGVLNHSARILRDIAGKKGLELIVDIDKSVPQHMHGDPHRIQQVVMNLINNAVKFTERGTVELKAFYMETEQPRLHVEVRDTGIGISKENMAKLFGAFSQADDSIARKYGGSGLGLNITKNLVKLMGGRIDVMSEEGKGSTFWFELPYQAPIAGAKTEEEEEGAVAEAPPQNILVAEDNEVNARIITRLLTHKGHHVLVVPSGDDVLRAVQEKEYNLIFMDVNMPGMNGYDATRAIQALGKKYKKIPIIGLSANIMEESVRKCYESGMVGHIPKPFAPRELYAAIANIAAGLTVQAPPPLAESAPPAQAMQPAQPVQPSSSMPVAASSFVRKSSPPQAKTMAQVQAAISDEMGPAYLKEMVDGNLKEAARLMESVLKEFKAKDFEAMGKSAHDLKSISGLIGMQRTSQLAAAVEQACITGEHARLPETVVNLEHVKTQESLEAERMSRGEAAAE